MGLDIQAPVFGFLLPALVSFVCLAIATRANRRRPRSILGALVISAVPIWSFCLDLGPLWPAENWQRLVWLGLLACIFNVAVGHKWILWISYSLFALLAAYLLVPDFPRLAEQRGYWLVAVPLVLLIFLDSSILLSHRMVGPALPFYFLLATLAAALVIFCASLLKFALVGGILASVMAGCCLACWWYPTRSLTSAIAPGWAVIYSGLLIEAKLYTGSDVPLASFILLLCAPLTIWLTAIPAMRKMKAGWRTALGILLLLTPIAVGLYWAGQVAIEDMTDSELPGWLLRILRQLLGKPPLIDMEE
jgi:hypothetical protein